jgi:hypothetical protein
MAFFVDLLLEQMKKTGCIITTVVFEISYTSTLLPLLSRKIHPEMHDTHAITVVP